MVDEERSADKSMIDVRMLAAINLAAQFLLTLAVVGAVHLARNKKFKRHCTVMRIAFPAQILAILLVMLPSMNGYLAVGSPGPIFRAEMLVHHTFGLVAVILWVYINLISLNYIRSRLSQRTAMRMALGCWILSLIMGLHLFVLVYAQSYP